MFYITCLLLSSLLLAGTDGRLPGKAEKTKKERRMEECPNMADLSPQSNFNEEKFLGLWYSVRWYLPDTFEWNHNTWDYSHRYFTKQDKPYSIFFEMNNRLKNRMYCEEPVQVEMKRVVPGKYSFQGSITSTIIYTDYDHMAILFGCHSPEATKCADMDVVFLSRTKKLTRDQQAKGTDIMETVCYPYPNRFMDDRQEMDCTPSPMDQKCNEYRRQKSTNMFNNY